jgi:hypothetical protein
LLDLSFASTRLERSDMRCEVFNGLCLGNAGSRLARCMQTFSRLDVSLYGSRLTRLPCLKLPPRLAQPLLSSFQILHTQPEGLIVSRHGLELIAQGIHLHRSLLQHSILRCLPFGQPFGVIQSRLGERQLLTQRKPRARIVVTVMIPAQACETIDTGSVGFNVLAQYF